MKTQPIVLFQYKFKHSKSTFLILAVWIFFFSASTTFADEEKMVSRLEFVSLMAKNQPGNPLIPAQLENFSEEELYQQVSKNLEANGFNILKGKSSQEILPHKEFVRLTYAFNGGKPGKSLFHQKMYLKQAQIISTADVGLTTGLDGKVNQIHAETNKDKDAELAGPVFMKDKIETDFNSMMEVTFDDESVLALGGDASVRITKHIYDPDRDLRQTIVKMSAGIVRFIVTKGKAKGSMFRVITPSGIAGVRGTEFVVKVDPDGKTTFIGIEGEIETAPIVAGTQKGEHNFVSMGKMQEIKPDGTTRGVFEASQGLLKKVIRLTTPTTVLTKNAGIELSKASKAASQKINLKEIEIKVDPQVASIVGGGSSFDVGGTTVGGVFGMAENLTDTLNETLDGITGQAIGTAGDTVNNTTATVNNVSDPAIQAAQSAATQAAQKAAQAAAQSAAKDAAVQAAKDSARKASMESAKENIKLATKQLIQTQGNISRGVPNPASVASGIGGTAGTAGAAGSTASGTVSGATSTVGGTVGGAVGGVGGTVGGGLGGLGGGLGGLGGGGGLLP